MKVTTAFFREWFGDIFFPLGFSYYKRVFYRKHGSSIQAFSVDNHRGILQLGFIIRPLGHLFLELDPENVCWLSANTFMDHLPIDLRVDDDVIYHRARIAVKNMLVPIFENATDEKSSYWELLRYFECYIVPSRASTLGLGDGTAETEIKVISAMLNDAAAHLPDCTNVQKLQNELPNLFGKLSKMMEKRQIEFISTEAIASRLYCDHLMVYCIQMKDYNRALMHLDYKLKDSGLSLEKLEELRKAVVSDSTLTKDSIPKLRAVFGKDAIEVYTKLTERDHDYFETIFSENERIWDDYLKTLPKNRSRSGKKHIQTE